MFQKSSSAAAIWWQASAAALRVACGVHQPSSVDMTTLLKVSNASKNAANGRSAGKASVGRHTSTGAYSKAGEATYTRGNNLKAKLGRSQDTPRLQLPVPRLHLPQGLQHISLQREGRCGKDLCFKIFIECRSCLDIGFEGDCYRMDQSGVQNFVKILNGDML